MAVTLDMFERRLSTLDVPLKVEFWNGRRIALGGIPKVRLALRRPAALAALLPPALGRFAEAYVEGDIDLDGDIHDIANIAETLCGPQQVDIGQRDPDWWKWWLHSRVYDKRAIQAHYDVSNEFYALWLDRQRVYSCAYFRNADDSLDTAQENKLDHICRKLNLQAGEQLLDIGCGWGALIFHAVKRYGVRALGITLSRQQHDYVAAQIQERELQECCEVRLLDYRDVPEDEPFDKISSVGMFEHVGKKKLPGYFTKIAALLKPGGVVMNHGLTSAGLHAGGLSRDIVRFIDRYVFPGGELPHLSREIELMASSGLECADVECLRPHYARTLWRWVERLDARQEEARALVGERRYRIWRIYMAGYALAFQRGWVSIYQVLAGKPRGDGSLALPITREYMYLNSSNKTDKIFHCSLDSDTQGCSHETA